MQNADVELMKIDFYLPPYIMLGMSLHKAIKYNKELVDWTVGRTLAKPQEHTVYKDAIGIRKVFISEF